MKLHTLRYSNPLSAILEDFLSIRFKPHQVVPSQLIQYPAHRIILVVKIKLLTVTNYGGFGKLSLSFQNLLYCMAVDESQNRPHENSGHFFDSQKAVLMCQSGTEQSLK